MALKIDLSSVGAFRFVSAESRQGLAQISKVIEKKNQEAILIHGEPVPGMYIVVEGEVGVYPPGLIKPLVTMGPMNCFGEMSFLEKTQASATIRAELDKTVLILIFHNELAELVENDASLGRALYKGIATNLSQKLRLTTERIAQELGAGRQLLLSLASDEVALSLGKLPAEVTRQSDLILDGLKSSVQMIEDVTRKSSEKSQQLMELQHLLLSTKDTCLAFYPKLAQQVAVVIDFVKRMERFILRITHD